TGLGEFDCTYRDFGERIAKSRDPVRPSWTAVVNVAIHEPRDQSTRPAVDDSNSSPATLPLGSGPYPVDQSIANLYGHFGLSRRARPIPKLNVVNQNVQFSHHYPRVPRTEKPINRIRKELYVNCGNTFPGLAL